MTMKQNMIRALFGFFVGIVSSNGFAQDQEIYQEAFFVHHTDTLKYRILYPKDFSKDKQYPLVLFLHGAGERGNDNRSQLIHGGKLFSDESHRANFPAVVIFPQCPKEDYWANVAVDRSTLPLTLTFQNGGEPTKALRLVMQLMEETIAMPYILQERVYVGGLSMGGMGTYEILYRKPSMFAAAFAICGGGDPDTVGLYADHTELWAFHGAKDNVVDPQLSINMVSAYLKAGGKPSFTLYADDNHNSWDSAFAEPKLIPWLFSKSKQQK